MGPLPRYTLKKTLGSPRAVPPRSIAPRVVLYSATEAPPQVGAGVLAFPELPAELAGGFVFGDGSHPTTRLCAGALDMMLGQKRPAAVLDVGTGTGILARIARARGVPFVVGTDIDPKALAWAARQCALDGHETEIELTNQLPDAWGARFDLIVANILEGPLTELAPFIAKAMLPSATLLLSGFTPLQVPALRATYEKLSLRFVQEARQGEWALLRFERALRATDSEKILL
jgi:ribosomal protein L11 methyltransferase